MAYVAAAHAGLGTDLGVEIRGARQGRPRRPHPVLRLPGEEVTLSSFNESVRGTQPAPSAATHGSSRPWAVPTIGRSMANVPSGLKYTKEHEWAKIEGIGPG